MVKRKLGRGLGSLLENALDETGKVIELDISKIHPNPWQPRRQFDLSRWKIWRLPSRKKD